MSTLCERKVDIPGCNSYLRKDSRIVLICFREHWASRIDNVRITCCSKAETYWCCILSKSSKTTESKRPGMGYAHVFKSDVTESLIGLSVWAWRNDVPPILPKQADRRSRFQRSTTARAVILVEFLVCQELAEQPMPTIESIVGLLTYIPTPRSRYYVYWELDMSS